MFPPARTPRSGRTVLVAALLGVCGWLAAAGPAQAQAPGAPQSLDQLRAELRALPPGRLTAAAGDQLDAVLQEAATDLAAGRPCAALRAVDGVSVRLRVPAVWKGQRIRRPAVGRLEARVAAAEAAIA